MTVGSGRFEDWLFQVQSPEMHMLFGIIFTPEIPKSSLILDLLYNSTRSKVKIVIYNSSQISIGVV